MSQEKEAENISFAFFGADEFSVVVLRELAKAGYMPARVITAPDRPKGRGLKLAPPPVKLWAEEKNIHVFQPEDPGEQAAEITDRDYDLFIVASYGKILPKELLCAPRRGSLNVHPSLLPLYRGASPVQSQILEGAHETGATVILMDDKIDHGPILAQALLFGVNLSNAAGLPSARKLGHILMRLGGKLLAGTISPWIASALEPQEQEQEHATYTKLIAKGAGQVDLADDGEKNFRKFRAFDPWPGVYFWSTNKRVKITDAELTHDGTFAIRKVIPEGKREMPYDAFLRGHK